MFACTNYCIFRLPRSKRAELKTLMCSRCVNKEKNVATESCISVLRDWNGSFRAASVHYGLLWLRGEFLAHVHLTTNHSNLRALNPCVYRRKATFHDSQCVGWSSACKENSRIEQKLWWAGWHRLCLGRCLDGEVHVLCLCFSLEVFWWRWGDDEGKQAGLLCKKWRFQRCGQWGRPADPVGCFTAVDPQLMAGPGTLTSGVSPLQGLGPAITCLLKFCTMERTQSAPSWPLHSCSGGESPSQSPGRICGKGNHALCLQASKSHTYVIYPILL